jgi:uncharacterized metal-binding protein
MYSQEDKEVMVRAAKARHKSRLHELIDFARLSGYKKIGLAACKSVWPLAERLEDLLKDAGFEVYAMHCKESGLEGKDISDSLSGASCDPLSQAAYLNACRTDLNVNVGLCLGHGILFQKHSDADVTTFLVKDFETGHKTVDCLLLTSDNKENP